MKKLIASMFGLSFLTLFLFSGDSRTIGVDDAGLQSMAECGEDHGEEDSDGSDKKSRLLAEEDEDDDDHDHDGSDKKSRLLADDDDDHDDDHDDDDHDHDGSDKKSRLLV